MIRYRTHLNQEKSPVPWLVRAVRVLVAVLAAALTVGAVGTGVAQAAVPDPVPATAPAVVEGFTPYLPQKSCDPVV